MEITNIDKEGCLNKLPISMRKRIYDAIMAVDLEEIDRNNDKGDYGVYVADEFPDIGIVISKDKVVALIKMDVYNVNSQTTVPNDQKIMVLAVPRDDIGGLLDE